MTVSVGMMGKVAECKTFQFLQLQREFWVVFHLFCYNEIMDLLSTSGWPQTETELTFTKMEITRNKIKHITLFYYNLYLHLFDKAQS